LVDPILEGRPLTNAIELLGRDHDEIRRLLIALETTPVPSVGAGRHDPCEALTEQLVIVESGHEAIEEEYFWPLVRRRVQNGPRLAEEALGQEQELKQVLCALVKHGPGHREFEALIRQFTAIGRAHIDFEETQVWPGVRLALSEQELDELGTHLEQGKRLAPTRPHPNMPSAPEALKVAAPIAGAADRIRDVLGGRHRP
jgi:hemerythrin-like domain-containing protein